MVVSSPSNEISTDVGTQGTKAEDGVKDTIGSGEALPVEQRVQETSENAVASKEDFERELPPKIEQKDSSIDPLLTKYGFGAGMRMYAKSVAQAEDELSIQSERKEEKKKKKWTSGIKSALSSSSMKAYPFKVTSSLRSLSSRSSPKKSPSKKKNILPPQVQNDVPVAIEAPPVASDNEKAKSDIENVSTTEEESDIEKEVTAEEKKEEIPIVDEQKTDIPVVDEQKTDITTDQKDQQQEEDKCSKASPAEDVTSEKENAKQIIVDEKINEENIKETPAEKNEEEICTEKNTTAEVVVSEKRDAEQYMVVDEKASACAEEQATMNAQCNPASKPSMECVGGIYEQIAETMADVFGRVQKNTETAVKNAQVSTNSAVKKAGNMADDACTGVVQKKEESVFSEEVTDKNDVQVSSDRPAEEKTNNTKEARGTKTWWKLW